MSFISKYKLYISTATVIFAALIYNYSNRFTIDDLYHNYEKSPLGATIDRIKPLEDMFSKMKIIPIISFQTGESSLEFMSEKWIDKIGGIDGLLTKKSLSNPIGKEGKSLVSAHVSSTKRRPFLICNIVINESSKLFIKNGYLPDSSLIHEIGHCYLNTDKIGRNYTDYLAAITTNAKNSFSSSKANDEYMKAGRTNKEVWRYVFHKLTSSMGIRLVENFADAYYAFYAYEQGSVGSPIDALKWKSSIYKSVISKKSINEKYIHRYNLDSLIKYMELNPVSKSDNVDTYMARYWKSDFAIKAATKELRLIVGF